MGIDLLILVVPFEHKSDVFCLSQSIVMVLPCLSASIKCFASSMLVYLIAKSSTTNVKHVFLVLCVHKHSDDTPLWLSMPGGDLAQLFPLEVSRAFFFEFCNKHIHPLLLSHAICIK